MMGKEARALGAVQQELAHRAVLVAPQLLHQLRQEEGDLRTRPARSARRCRISMPLTTSDGSQMHLSETADTLVQRQ